MQSADIFLINFFEKKIKNSIRVSISFDLDRNRCYVIPDLTPNCLQRLSSAEEKASACIERDMNAGFTSTSFA